MVTIATMNVRGLRDETKRLQMFAYMKKQMFDIVLIQESHATEADEQWWAKQWGGKIIYANGDSKSRGVCILFRKGLNVSVGKTTKCAEGRFVLIDCVIDEKEMLIANVYAPNVDNPDFFVKLFTEMAAHQSADRIIAGDFNLVLNKQLDACNRKNNNENALRVVNAYIEDAMLIDIWRHKNPKEFSFTWSRRAEKIYARLDFMLVNCGMATDIECVKNLPAFRSDHGAVKIKLQLNPDQKRGPGLWKLNTSLLEKSEFVNKINSTIEKALVKATSEEYDKCMKWEFVKSVTVRECQRLSKERANKFRMDFEKIQQSLEKLKIELCDQNNTQVQIDALNSRIEETEMQMGKFLQYKLKGTQIRSRAKWYEEAEKSTKFFFGLERVRSNNKNIRQLICEDNSITRDLKKILLEQKKFYAKLYTNNPEVAFHFTNENATIHNVQQKAEIDQPFTFEQFSAALKSMARNKTPGSDGLPCEFYVMFWTKIGKTVWDAIQLSHERGELYTSARRGVISLTPKKQKNLNFLKHYRPLCLLNVDCKIATKMLVNRIKPHLDEIISKDQSGYIPGRFIGINIRKLIDMLMYLEREETPAILLSIDFHKCFDSISHEALFKSLAYFGIGEYYISWVRMIYNNFELCVINNGRCSPQFKQLRGVHQGCALSGPMFIYIAQILNVNIQNNSNIQGIKIGDVEEKLSQYADDTNLWSIYKEKSVNAIIDELEKFYLNTGLQVNYDKSVIYRVGGARSLPKLKLKKNFKWSTDPIDVLGMMINIDKLSDLESDNYENILQKAANNVNIWRSRDLSIIGKVHIVNSLIGSLFTYKMQTLPIISKTLENKINALISKFIWNARRPKIRLEVLCSTKQEGGLKLVSIADRDKSLKTEWVKRNK